MAKRGRIKNSYNSVYFHLNKELEAEIALRAESGAGADAKAFALIAKRDVTRYYALLRNALERLELEQKEMMLLCDILHGKEFTPNMDFMLEIADSDIELFAKWKVFRGDFIDKVAGWSKAEITAVFDAVERFWLDTATLGTPDNPYGERLRRAGFLVGEV